VGASTRILDESRVEVDGRQTSDLLPHDTAEESIAAANLQDALAPGQHLRDKLVPGKRERQPFRIVEVRPARHQPKPLKTAVSDQLNGVLVLDLAFVIVRHSSATRLGLWVGAAKPYQSSFRYKAHSDIASVEFHHIAQDTVYDLVRLNASVRPSGTILLPCVEDNPPTEVLEMVRVRVRPRPLRDI